MGAIWLRVRSWLRTRWATAVGLVLVIAVVGGVSVALVAGAARTATVIDRKIDSLPFEPDVTIEQSGGPPGLEALRALPAVENAELATFFFGGLLSSGGGDPAQGIVFVGSSIEPLGAEGLLEGRLPSGEDPGEFVATPSYVAALQAELGDRFELITISQAEADRAGFDGSLDGPVVPATLVGIIDEGVSALESDYPLGFFDLALLDEGDIGVSGGEGIVDLAPGATIEDLRDQLDELDDGAAYSLQAADAIDDEVRTAVEAQAQGVLVLALIVAATAVVVLGQLLSRQLRLADGERMILRSVGFSDGQVMADPLVRAGVVVVVGVGVGAVAAFLASGLFPVGFSRQVEPEPGLRFEPLVHGLGVVLLAVLVLVVTALLLAGQRRRPAEPRPSTVVDRLVAAAPSARLGTAVRFAFGPGSRTGATASSLVGLVLVMALVVGAVTFGWNLARLLDEPERYGAVFDIGIGQGGEEVPPAVIDTVQSSPDVDAAMLYGSATVSVGTESFGLVAFEPVRGDLLPEVLDGRLPQGADELALGLGAAEGFGVEVGDELEVSFGEAVLSFRVVGIAIVGGIEGSDVAGENGLVTGEGLQRIDPEDRMSTVGVSLDPDAPPGADERLAEALGETSIGPLDPPTAVVNLSRVRGVPFLVAGLVGLLLVLTLGHQLLVAVRRRARDFAVLRSFGATSRWVGGVVHWQASLSTAVAVVLAIPLGVLAGSLLYRPYAEGVGARGEAALPVGWLVGGFVVLVVVANLVAAIPARRIRRLSLTALLTRS